MVSVSLRGVTSIGVVFIMVFAVVDMHSSVFVIVVMLSMYTVRFTLFFGVTVHVFDEFISS